MFAQQIYIAPKIPALRWLGDVGSDLPAEIQHRLRGGFFTSRTPLVVGVINSAAVAFTAYWRLNELLLLYICLLDLALGALRCVLVRRVGVPADLIFATGTLWAAMMGMTTAIIVASSDGLMSIVALASCLGAVGGIVGRNHAAPRYAMLQVLLIELSYKLTFCSMHPEFIPLLVFQAMIFVTMNLAIVRQMRASAIAAIRNEIAGRKLAAQDALTGLVNRRGLDEAFKRLSERQSSCAILYIDLDNFKSINDTMGHAAGDRVICDVATILREGAPESDTACRLGGDEFVLLVCDIDRDGLAQRAMALIEKVGRLRIGSTRKSLKVGASVGIATGIAARDGLADLLNRADDALYAAKSNGKNSYVAWPVATPAVDPGRLAATMNARAPSLARVA